MIEHTDNDILYRLQPQSAGSKMLITLLNYSLNMNMHIINATESDQGNLSQGMLANLLRYSRMWNLLAWQSYLGGVILIVVQ